MENTNTGRIGASSITRRDMLTTAMAAAILSGEGATCLDAQSHPSPPSPDVQAQRRAFFALWLLLSAREDFFVIDTSGGTPAITCPQQSQIAADLQPFFTAPTTQMAKLIALMKTTDRDTRLPYHQAFRAVRSFFHTLGTVKVPGVPAPPPYQPGEVCGKVGEIMAVAGVSTPQTKEAGS